MTKGEIAGLLNSSGERFQEGVNHPTLATEAGENGQVDVFGEPLFTPMLDGDASNNAKFPVIINR